MFGMNSTVPTMYIGPSPTTSSWGNVGIGTGAPVATLQVQAMNGTNQLGRYTVAGKSGSLSIIDTQSGSSTTPFAPAIMGYGFSEGHRALRISGRIDTGADAGTVPVMTFDSRADGSEVTNRPLFEWSNYLSQRMTMLANGNLGIGTATPEAVLHLKTPTGTNTTLRMDRNASGYDAALRFFSGSTERGHVMSDNQNTLWLRNTNSNSDVRLGVNVGGTATTAVTVRGNSGNVGIGTTTPSGKLHVNGTVFANLSTSASTTGLNSVMVNSTTGELKEYTSTINHKTQVADLEFDKQAFFSLRPVQYRWKDAHGGAEDIGLIAEEVQEHMPNMVNYNYKHTYIDETTGEMLRDSMGNPVLDTTQLQPWGVDYRKISIYLMALAKEQEGRLNALETALEKCCRADSPQYRLDPVEMKGQEDKREAGLKVYPNPNDGNFTVNYALPDGVGANLYLITTSGQKMLLSQNIRSSGKEVFNISGPSGVYHLLLEGADGRLLHSTKIVVAH